MIDIKRGDSTYRVSKGSYEIYFKPLGFSIVEPKNNKEEKSKDEEVKTLTEAKSKKVGAK